MDIVKLMECYTSVVKLESFTRAAKELGATRAMVSKRIAHLEKRLGVKLLNRNTHGLSVTSAGADYYENCVRILAEIKGLDERMLDKQTSIRGTLKLFANRTFSETVLAPIISDFCLLHPGISVQITLIDRENETYGMHLIAGGYDMGILAFPMSDSSLIARAIGRLPQTLVAAPKYLREHGVPTTPEDLSKHNCLDPNGAPHSVWELNGAGGTASVRVSGSIQTNGTLMIRHAAIAGIGIAMVREYLVIDHIADGSLIRILPEYKMNERIVYVVYQKSAYQPARIKAFAEYLTARLADGFGKEQKAKNKGIRSPRAKTPLKRAKPQPAVKR